MEAFLMPATPLISLKLNSLLSKSPPRSTDSDWRAFSRALLNASPNGIFVVDETGAIAISNKVIQKEIGLFPGTRLEPTLPHFWPTVKRTLQDRKYRSEVTVRKQARSYLVSLGPVLWENALIGVLCIFEEITKLEQVTLQMRSFQELNRELDTIIESSHDGLWICDGNARVIKINSASERLNNIRAKDVLGKSMQELVADGFVDKSATLKVLKTGKTANVLQKIQNGRKLMISANPVFDATGRLIRVVVTERDITELDSLQKELDKQAGIRDRYRHHMLELQIEELESNRIIARSTCFLNILQQALKVARFDSTVLILGESGVGKGVIADLVHKYSTRSHRPMIKLNCGTIPESLVESELFGYEKGAFTGAGDNGKPGYFELADGGILFLDEIAELPQASQVKLLRFLEDGQIYRVGGTKHRKLNVRILAATNRNLKAMVKNKTFRQDLFYRLNVIPLQVPPLRERYACILPLIDHYIAYFADHLKLDKKYHLTREASDVLQAYKFPGNVRELMNLCERVVVLTEKSRISLEDLPQTIINGRDKTALNSGIRKGQRPLQQILASVEKETLAYAMEIHGTQMLAAKALYIDQSTIARKLKKHGLK
jgi:PAS domain S-box-containing protein